MSAPDLKSRGPVVYRFGVGAEVWTCRKFSFPSFLSTPNKHPRKGRDYMRFQAKRAKYYIYIFHIIKATTCFWDIVTFLLCQDGGSSPSWIFGGIFETPARVPCGFYRCSKCGCHLCSSFNNTKVSLFDASGWKNAYLRPQNCFFLFDPASPPLNRSSGMQQCVNDDWLCQHWMLTPDWIDILQLIARKFGTSDCVNDNRCCAHVGANPSMGISARIGEIKRLKIIPFSELAYRSGCLTDLTLDGLNDTDWRKDMPFWTL